MRTLVEVRRVHYYQPTDLVTGLEVDMHRVRCPHCEEMICEYNVWDNIPNYLDDEEEHSVL